MTIVRTNTETGLFEIVRTDENDVVLEVLVVFPVGTTNAEACAAYDAWRNPGGGI